MPIEPSMLAKSIGTLTNLQPQQDLAKTLQDAVVAPGGSSTSTPPGS